MGFFRTGFVCAFLLFALLGCETPQSLNNDTNAAQPKVAFTAAELIEKHNTRVAKLDQLHAFGVIEITWTDERGGKHTDQGDAELWIDQPSKTAMRVDKVGEVLLWLGSNEQSWWLFDMLNKPTTLHTGPVKNSSQRLALGEIVSVHPLVLLDLLGITSIEYVQGEGAMYSAESKHWNLRVAGANAPLKLTFNEAGQLITIAALDDNNVAIATSALRDFESAKVVGTNPLNWPKSATHVVITLADQSGSVLLALNNNMEAALDETQASRIFDLEVLKKSLRPERVETDGE